MTKEDAAHTITLFFFWKYLVHLEGGTLIYDVYFIMNHASHIFFQRATAALHESGEGYTRGNDHNMESLSRGNARLMRMRDHGRGVGGLPARERGAEARDDGAHGVRDSRAGSRAGGGGGAAGRSEGEGAHDHEEDARGHGAGRAGGGGGAAGRSEGAAEGKKERAHFLGVGVECGCL